jgi:hypothetical protein
MSVAVFDIAAGLVHINGNLTSISGSIADPFFHSLLVMQEVTQEVTQDVSQCRGQMILTAEHCWGDGSEVGEDWLYHLINEYRAQYGLPAIPRSPSLTLVANRHVLDLAQNMGYLTHSWSNCPYNSSDRRTFRCAWEAPQRLGTAYRGRAFENAHYNSTGATAESAFRGWQTSPEHNALILNSGPWRKKSWKAIGIGLYQNYAVMWVGEKADPAEGGG